MAVGNWSSNASMVKAVMLPSILVLLAMAAGVSSTEDAPVAKAGGRFSENPLGRKLLTIKNPCGPGLAPYYGCRTYLPLAKNATCCPDPFGTPTCWDVGAFDLLKCGSCTTACKIGEVCCSGVCANLLTDKNNCGICGNKCTGVTGCNFGLCGY